MQQTEKNKIFRQLRSALGIGASYHVARKARPFAQHWETPESLFFQVTGRESDTLLTPPYWDEGIRGQDFTDTTTYTENYEYDIDGNLLSLQHVASSNNYTRNYVFGGGRLSQMQLGLRTQAWTLRQAQCPLGCRG